MEILSHNSAVASVLEENEISEGANERVQQKVNEESHKNRQLEPIMSQFVVNRL